MLVTVLNYKAKLGQRQGREKHHTGSGRSPSEPDLPPNAAVEVGQRSRLCRGHLVPRPQ